MPDQKPQIATGLQRDAARRKAMDHFTAAEKRDTEVRREIEREREAFAVRTAKLRALRMVKEEEERIAAANAPPKSKSKAKARTAR